MTTAHHENLSALIDGALDKSQTAFLMRRLGHDEELRAACASYHLIGDCLRRNAGITPVGAAFADRIRTALSQEAPPPRRLPWQTGMQWAAGFFTAAIVAAGAFWYVQPDDGAGDALVATPSAASASEVVSSGVRADELRRQLPLLPVSARQSRPVTEFAPQPDPEAWQRAPVTPLHYPSTQYIIVLPPSRAGEDTGPGAAAEQH